MPDVDTLIRDPRWLLWRFEPPGPTAVFAYVERDELSRTAFADMRLDDPQRALTRVGWAEVEAGLETAPDVAAAPARRFIMHSAFCGSTLASRSLEALGHWVAIREPLTILSLANFRRFRNPVSADPWRWRRMVSGVLRLLGRSHRAGDSVVIKPSNGANALIPDLVESAPEPRVLLMYASMESFMVSVLGRGEAGGRFARDYAMLLAAESDTPERYTAWIPRLEDARVAGLAWHLQLRQFQRLVRRFDPTHLRTLFSEDFFGDPAASIRAITSFFGDGEAAEDDVARVAGGPLFRTDAKQPGVAYQAEARESARRRIGDELQDAVASVRRWLDRVFPDDRVELPLKQNLL